MSTSKERKKNILAYQNLWYICCCSEQAEQQRSINSYAEQKQQKRKINS